MIQQPVLIDGGVHRDERGTVRHVNRFDLKEVDRFYVITPARPRELRGWVGHRRDHKWFFSVQGEFRIYVLPLVELEESSLATPDCYLLSTHESKVLAVPGGYATAISANEVPSSLLVFSSGKIEDSAADMLRYPLGSTVSWENLAIRQP
jgi:dTDP-4-dehydrorhamnose 3,5-epimerase-like enzyme